MATARRRATAVGWRTAIALVGALGWGSCASGGARGPQPLGLAGVHRWAVQLQGVDEPFAVNRLEAVPADMLVIDAVRSVRGNEGSAVSELVRRLRHSRGASGRGKICLAYLNVGQAEDYRCYWGADWRAPSAERTGTPDFLVTVDPDGWPGNYPVAYWDRRWRSVLFGDPRALLDQILEDGFDGVYLDWVMGFEEPAVVRAARRAGVDPAVAMVELIASLRDYARETRPDFVLVAQNAVDLGGREPRLFELIDGLAQEDLSFSGSAEAAWGDAASGDIPAPASGPWSTAELGQRLLAVRRRRIPIFTLDYARVPENAEAAAATSRSLGFVPFVSRTPLDRLPTGVFAAPSSPR